MPISLSLPQRRASCDLPLTSLLRGNGTGHKSNKSRLLQKRFNPCLVSHLHSIFSRECFSYPLFFLVFFPSCVNHFSVYFSASVCACVRACVCVCVCVRVRVYPCVHVRILIRNFTLNRSTLFCRSDFSSTEFVFLGMFH